VRLNLIKFFVDLIGSATPDQTDRDQVCSILKDALLKIDVNVPRTLVECTLNEKTSAKRDAHYVADLTYPGNEPITQEDSAVSLVASFVAVAAAVVALLF